MNRQHILCEQVKEMFSQKFMYVPYVEKILESGDITIIADIKLVTNVGKRTMECRTQFVCEEKGIVTHTVLMMQASPRSYQRVVDWITQENGRQEFTWFEFDYAEGRVGAQNYLHCKDYVPSLAMLYTIFCDVNSMFIDHGDQLLELMRADDNTVKKSDVSKAVDVLDGALSGDETAKTLLMDALRSNPDSPLRQRLICAANDGNKRAQALLRQLHAENVMGSVDVSKVSMPEILPREVLLKATQEKVWPVLQKLGREGNNDIGTYVQSLQNASRALAGSIRDCSEIAAFLFVNERLPQIFDPYIAYQWYMWGKVQTNVDNWAEFVSMPGHSFEGVIDMFEENMAEMLLMFGSREQKLRALHIIKAYVDEYWGEAYLCRDHLLYALLGMPPCDACRKMGYELTDVPQNRELAVSYYKRIIDEAVANGHHSQAKYWAENFEDLLGIQYYESSRNGNSASSTTSTGGCYIATCVYGSYDCPQVWTLRRFRDYVLVEHAWGRLFVRIYYAMSPYLVKKFGSYAVIRSLWKRLLDRMVCALREKGCQDTPYED